MTRTLAILFLIASAPSLIRAAPATIGVYDDIDLTRTSGVMTDVMKVIYVGIVFEPNWEGFTGLEFSVAGLEPFFWQVEYLGNPTLVLGTIAAPSDTTNGTGGIYMGWPKCLENSHFPVAKLTLFSGTPPQDHILQVGRTYPPSNPNRPYPKFWICDAPCFGLCSLRADSGSYRLNPTVAVEAHSWGAVKRFYR